jgi:hypothetical protein
MNYRFYLTIGSSEIEVFPLNFFKTSLVDAKEERQIFYRRKFSGTLRFYNDAKLGITDFTLINLVETLILAGSLDCQDLLLRIEQKNSGANTYHTYWEGRFATSDGKFDLDNCTFEVTPLPYDDYTNFDENGDTEYNILDITTEYTTNSDTTAYTHNRLMSDVIDFIVKKIEPAATITSWFLNDEFNPVTGELNMYRYLMISQKSDFKRPEAADPATIGMMSFNQLMDILRGMYNLYWKWDGTTLRIEHQSYWDNTAGLDLRLKQLSQRSNKYSHKTEDLYRQEKFSFMEAGDSNYTTHIISYDIHCTPNTIFEYSNNVTTDVSYIEKCIEDKQDTGLESNISDSGWVITSNSYDSIDYFIYFGKAFENTVSSINYPNSWSYLLNVLHLHDRILMTGYINENYIEFISAKKTKVQQINAIICYDDGYNSNDYITTELGEDYFLGQKGYVDNATIHPDGLIEFKLLYGEDRNIDVIIPTPPKSITCAFYSNTRDDWANAWATTTLSEPSPYNIYFWILWDDGLATEDCQEIFIPAGTLTVVDDVPVGVASYTFRFNISDTSMSGWDFIVYNRVHTRRGDPIAADTTVTDVECGGYVPPAAPVAPVCNFPNQYIECQPVYVIWGAVADATSYQIWRKPNTALEDVWGIIETTWRTNYTDSQAGENQDTYSYRIRACNISGCSPDSNNVWIVTDCPPEM